MSTTDQLNTALDGRYAIERRIGEGGMAVVYLARDLKHNRRVALKVLRPDLNAVLGTDRFLAEIQVTANLQHPNLLPLFDSGVVDQLLFYVMPFVEGESLRARLDREKQLPVDEVVRLITSMANALDYAHRNGVIHRDLKPENVLLQEGQPLVADFGIALAVSNAGAGRITQTGLSLGTPQYMSPEQATGERAIDARTDQYSLGALAYEMLTGEPPHVGATSQAIIARLLTETPRAIRAVRASVPVHVEAAVARALQKLPADRWSSTREFAQALTNPAMTATGVPPFGVGAPAATRSRVSRAREAAAWAVAVGALAATAYFATRTSVPSIRDTPITFDIELPTGLRSSNIGGDGSVALDAAGTVVAFQARDSISPQAFYLRRFADSAIVRVAGTENASAPSFAPDGRELRFFRALDTLNRSAYTIPISGGQGRPWITATAFNSRVSERAGGPVVVTSRAGLGIAPADGGAVRLLRPTDSVFRRFALPAVLPGSKATLVTAWVRGTHLDSAYIALVSLANGSIQRLAIRGLRPRYSTTGHLLWVSPKGELWAAAWSPSSPLENGPKFRIAEGVFVGPGGGASYAVSDNGILAYVKGSSAFTGEERMVVAVNRAGVERPLSVPPSFQQHPRLSPDGTTLLLTRGVNGESALRSYDIWRVDLARRTPTRVTLDSSSMRPFWFPDNQRVAFIRRFQDSSVAWVRRVDGTGTPMRVGTRGVFVRAVSVSPRGDYLALAVGGSDESGGDDVWLVHTDSLNAPRPWLADAYREFNPRFSPDGKWLAYESTRDGGGEIFARALTGGPAIKISVDGGHEPVWSRQGDELFFHTDRRQLMSARLSFTRGVSVASLTPLFETQRYVWSTYGQYDVTSDGQFLFLRGASTPTDATSNNRIHVVVDWPLLAGKP